MDLLSLFILAVGLSMDAFAVSICKGLSQNKLTFKAMFTAGAWFGAFQAIMPAIGYFAGAAFADKITAIDHWIAFILLVIIGGNMIREALFEKDDERLKAEMYAGEMFLLAVATSIDALAVGVTFAFLKVNIFTAAIFIGFTTFIISAAGVAVGNYFGLKYKKKSEIAGGIILILIGTRILLEHMGYL
ncbi:MAG: manganese efflux pump MntP family protein [Lachnospiraceae bacterium]|nr:manganese efflux pump MntP family protein [Lachnospiraceae bacterium]